MGDIRFLCPECKTKLVVDETVGGYKVPCPNCQKTILIPRPSDTNPVQEPSRGNLLTQDEIDHLSQNP